MFSVAHADGIQWDDVDPDNPVIVYESDDSASLNPNDQMLPAPKPENPPDAGSPLNPPGPVVDGPSDPPPAGVFGWWDVIAQFFDSIIESLSF